MFEKGIIINEVNKQMYNQVAGRTLNGYFKDGQLDYMRVKGSPAESVFYPQDDDSAYTGMNRSSSDIRYRRIKKNFRSSTGRMQEDRRTNWSFLNSINVTLTQIFISYYNHYLFS